MTDIESGPSAKQEIVAVSPEPSIPQAFAGNLAAMVSKSGTKVPKDALKSIYAAGKVRAAMTLDVLIVQSLMAGIYIGMAMHLLLAIGGGALGAVFFPIGLLGILLTSAELFTGDILIFVPSVLAGHVSVRSVCRNWTVSWFGNMAGCLAWAYFMVYLPGALEDVGKNEFAIKVALAKANQAWGAIFLKGIGANFMVCLAIWQATCAEDLASKLLAIFLPLSGFVLMGLEHCIANQFIIPLGMMLGADISVTRLFFQALLPATLGNLAGGGLLFAAVYWYALDSKDTIIHFRERVLDGKRKPDIGSPSPALTSATSHSHAGSLNNINV